MSTHILIVFICAAVGAFAGYTVMRTYKRNFVYLDGVCKIVDELKRNISYRRDSVATVLQNTKTDSSLLNKHIEKYIEFAHGKTDGPEIDKMFLPEETYRKSFEFFGTIGKADGNSQTDQLKMFGDAFGKMRGEAETKYLKFGAVAVKLGFLFGLGIGVLTL